ncbi:Plasmid replication protein RepX [Paenibacillus sp. P1XP2]|nr:Plasmid replication protein RepX [Paenibacillus sp. P1XP2]
MNISLKYGFLGLGMGGTSIAHACAGMRLSAKSEQRPYTALLINSNEMDLLKLPDYPNIKKVILSGYERGVGRDIQLGQEAFNVHKETIAETLQSFFNDRDYIFICCGLGGGTGTGSVIEAIRLLHAKGFAGRFGLLLTLPRRNEGRRVLDNALQRLQVIKRAMQGLGAIIVVDNEKLFQTGLSQSQSVEDFMKSCNRHVARLLHDLNTVTASYKPYGSYHFDSSEWLNMLRTGGCLHIAKCTLPAQTVDLASPVTYMEALKQSVLNGELSAGYDLQDATSSAVSIVADGSTAKRLFTHTFVEQIQSFLHDSTPILDENPVATYVGDQLGQVTIYTVFAGLNFPDSVKKLTEELTELERKAEERTQKTDAIAEALAGIKPQEKKAAVDLESLLSVAEPASAPAQEEGEFKDPFDFLNNLK